MVEWGPGGDCGSELPAWQQPMPGTVLYLTPFLHMLCSKGNAGRKRKGRGTFV